VVTEYPEHVWKPWRFDRVSKSWWHRAGTNYGKGDVCAEALVNELVLDVEQSLQITTPNQWFLEPRTRIGEKIVRQFDAFGSLWLAVLSLHASMLPTLYTGTSGLVDNAWTSLSQLFRHETQKSNHIPLHRALRGYFEYLLTKYKLADMYSFYTFSNFDTIDHRRIQSLGRLPIVLQRLFPEFAWSMAKFSIDPTADDEYWKTIVDRATKQDADVSTELKSFANHCALLLGADLGLDEVSKKSLRALPTTFQRRIESIGGVQNLLRLAYPGQTFNSAPHRKQRGLRRQVDKVIQT